MTALTIQERLFVERLASYLPDKTAFSHDDLRAAGERVLADDRRLVSQLLRHEALRREVCVQVAADVYDRVNASARAN